MITNLVEVVLTAQASSLSQQEVTTLSSCSRNFPTISFLARPAKAEITSPAWRQRQAKCASHPHRRQDKSRHFGVLCIPRAEGRNLASHERPGRTENLEGEVLEGLQHLGLINQRDSHGIVPERLFRAWNLRHADARLYLRHLLDARRVFLLGSDRSQL